jgi:MoaA/NifB/PqqE/SkfB family radical SAM enzyme
LRPLSVHMYLTTVCNLACTHCYYDAKRAGDDEGKLLTTAEVAQVIEILSSNFDADLHVEGGEMFLRDDIEEILMRVSAERHKSLTFTTSGTVPIRVSPGLLKGIGELRISVEGHTDALQQRMRPANLVRVRRTIDGLLANEVDFTLRVTLFRDNAPVLKEMIETFIGWGVKRLSLFEFQPVGRGEQHIDMYYLSDVEFTDVLSTLAGMNVSDKLELLKLNLSPRRTAPAQAFRDVFAERGYRYLPLDAIPNLTINANGDLGISPWLATAARLGDKFANLHEVEFATEISRRVQSGDLSTFCPYTSALQIRYSHQ